MLHFIAFALWIGCLYPFLQLSKSTSLEILQKTLKRFGDNAIAILSILFLAGILMSWELLDSPFDLINTGYGVVLLVKLVLVAAILAVAAINKLVLVPSMLASVSISRLQTSIRVELAIALAILIVTSYLSTVVGPASHQM
ncbi:CopD family protein [Gammaproteobacteria bacterium]|nr:CopD family protein [Gammaproteobacteria bacterium]